MASPQPAVPRATGFLRACISHDKKAREVTKTTHLIFAATWDRRPPTTVPARASGCASRARNAGFMPPKHHLDLLDETVRV